MYWLGHVALGYICGKIIAKQLKLKVITPLLFLASIFPDVDMVFNPFGWQHQGPLHSPLTILFLSIPFMVMFRCKFLPYLAAALSHPVLGDTLTSRIMLFWPLGTTAWGYHFPLGGKVDSFIELVAFSLCLVAMVRAKELSVSLRHIWFNLLGLMASVALFGSLLFVISTFPVPLMLLLPHLALIGLLVVSSFRGLALIRQASRNIYLFEKKRISNRV